MALTKSLYKGKRELTMAQFEALSSIDENIDYNIMDYPDNGMTNAQLTETLNYTRLFNIGYITICLDDGTFGKGHIVQLQQVDNVRTWVDVTANIHIDLSEYVKNTDYASQSKVGLVRGNPSLGTYVDSSNGTIAVFSADNDLIDAKANNYRPITPKYLDYAIKSGLTTNSLTWTPTEKERARNLLGVGEVSGVTIRRWE